jgi:hypothetical protein
MKKQGDFEMNHRRIPIGGTQLFEGCGFLPLADVKDIVVYRSGLTDLGTRPAIPWNVDFGMISEN